MSGTVECKFNSQYHIAYFISLQCDGLSREKKYAVKINSIVCQLSSVFTFPPFCLQMTHPKQTKTLGHEISLTDQTSKMLVNSPVKNQEYLIINYEASFALYSEAG